MDYYLGIDLGGTNLRAAIVDTRNGQILVQRRRPTLAAEGQEVVIQRIIDLAREVLAGSEIPPSEIGGIGIGVPGTPDIEQGVIVLLTNLPGQWRGVPLQSRIEEAIHLPVALINDVRAMTLSEGRFGAGRGIDNFACIAIGTGIGGGIVLNGQLYLGLGGTAGEFGHQVVEIDGLPCGCGSTGCLELYASGPAIAAMAVKEVMHGHTTRIGEMVGYDINRITVEVVAQAARDGDRIARQILHKAGGYLGIAISNIISTLSPEKIIFGGGVSQIGDLLLASVIQTIHQRVRVVPVDEIAFEQSSLGLDAGLIGAALWIKRRCEET